ncbi:MAG TPA: hypothetical protein VH764_18780 [Gemmatimonadales bacterium]|jgi:hypothetical protein
MIGKGLLALLALSACAPRSTPPAPEPEVIEEEGARSDADRRGPLGIPEGELPSPGQCRVWYPGRPSAQQPATGGCTEAEKAAPPGSWILYRPTDDQGVVHNRVTHPVRRGVIVRIDLYDAERGTYLGTKETGEAPPANAESPAEPSLEEP